MAENAIEGRDDRKVVKFRRRASKRRGAFCETPTASYILGTLERCQTHAEMRWIVGASGIGKTTTIRHYQRTHDRVYVATASPIDDDRNRLVRTIAQALGWSLEERSIYDLHAHIRAELHHRHQGPALLIVDEVQNLNAAGYEVLRHFHDVAECGVVLSGNPVAVDRFRSAKKRAEYAALLSRLGQPIHLTGLIPEDLEAICAHHAVSGVRARDLLTKIGLHPAGLRDVMRIIDHAREAIGNTEKPVELSHIQAAMEFLGLD